MKKNMKVCTITAYERTMATREHFNPYQCGTGAFTTDKHMNRAKKKAQFRKELKEY